MRERVESLKKIKSIGGKKKKIEFFKECGDECIDIICEGCYNITRGNIKLRPDQLKKLQDHKFYIRKLADGKVSNKVKRKILTQDGNGVLGMLASTLLPLLISSLAK